MISNTMQKISSVHGELHKCVELCYSLVDQNQSISLSPHAAVQCFDFFGGF